MVEDYYRLLGVARDAEPAHISGVIREQIREWLDAARMRIVQDTTDMTYGDWGYRHLLLQRTLNLRPGTPDEARSDP